MGCYKDVNFTDLPYIVMTTTTALTSSNIAYCYYSCANQGFMYMAIQNSTTCACGYKYGQYGPASNSSMCTKCSSSSKYNCGGSGVNGGLNQELHILSHISILLLPGITYLNFFQIHMICPLVVAPYQTFTCTVQFAFNLQSGQTLADPFAITVYPTYESTYNSYDVEIPLPPSISNSYGFDASVLSSQISLTYDNVSSTRTIYAYPTYYGVAYSQQTIFVVTSNNILDPC